MREILYDLPFVRVAPLEDFADVIFFPLRRIAGDAAMRRSDAPADAKHRVHCAVKMTPPVPAEGELVE
ncbi:hypothetical protein EH240_30125 [Mesorhizobium tamadayense]|uniref:Uncharacterized protein n=1 Tax=Mesorhizobium tamadayense TaxID=425306 RepID=A0A3P3F4Q2_9HYPH|nr:hypothetical protein [Mesorhizobium tamadayense]RRH93206.1 hypothetical protein EH240_30125 [Mesorhizobium tamadayense]